MSGFALDDILASAASANPSTAVEETVTAHSHGAPEIPITPALQARVNMANALDNAAEFVRGNPLLAFGMLVGGAWLFVRVRAHYGM
jgi:hypothetical protein